MLADLIGGTALEVMLHQRWREGLVIGGTSAGAAAMSRVMILGGPGAYGAARDAVVLGRGLGFVKRVIVDQHSSERQRLGRLLAAVREHPDTLGVGIDGDTAVVLRGVSADVLGSGAVTLVERQPTDTSIASGAGHRTSEEEAALVLHSVKAGQRFPLCRQRSTGLPGTVLSPLSAERLASMLDTAALWSRLFCFGGARRVRAHCPRRARIGQVAISAALRARWVHGVR